MGAFETLLELLDIYPMLPAEASLTVKSTLVEWKVFTRTEAVAALILKMSSNEKNPCSSPTTLEEYGGGTQIASEGITDLQIQRAGRWKSGAFVSDVRKGVRGRGKY